VTDPLAGQALAEPVTTLHVPIPGDGWSVMLALDDRETATVAS
jgi:hypothetical protein